MSVTLLEVMAAASRRVASLTGECVGYLVLAAADQLARAPRVIAAENVGIEESGAVRIFGGSAAQVLESEQSLRQLLDELMLLARNGSAALMRAGRRHATGDLEQLVKELEVALIPANRAAAARSLARLHRETVRALQAGSLAPVAATPGLETAPLPPEPPSHGIKAAADEPIEVDVEVEMELEPEPEPAPAEKQAAPRAEPLSAVPVEPALIGESERAEFETPAEPAVRRRATQRIVPESPDIHRTPYLGTLVAPLTQHGAARVPEPADPLEGDGVTTDPMPEVVEWIESEELEEVALVESLAWPEPPVGDRTVPPAPRCFRAPESDVRDLIARFRVAEPDPTAQLLRGLKELAGLSATPPPAAAAAPRAGADQREAGGPAQGASELQPLVPMRSVTIVGS